MFAITIGLFFLLFYKQITTFFLVVQFDYICNLHRGSHLEAILKKYFLKVCENSEEKTRGRNHF